MYLADGKFEAPAAAAADDDDDDDKGNAVEATRLCLVLSILISISSPWCVDGGDDGSRDRQTGRGTDAQLLSTSTNIPSP